MTKFAPFLSGAVLAFCLASPALPQKPGLPLHRIDVRLYLSLCFVAGGETINQLDRSLRPVPDGYGSFSLGGAEGTYYLGRFLGFRAGYDFYDNLAATAAGYATLQVFRYHVLRAGPVLRLPLEVFPEMEEALDLDMALKLGGGAAYCTLTPDDDFRALSPPGFSLFPGDATGTGWYASMEVEKEFGTVITLDTEGRDSLKVAIGAGILYESLRARYSQAPSAMTFDNVRIPLSVGLTF